MNGKQQTAEEFNLLKVDLYENSVKLPDGSDSCFGYLQTENEFTADYWIIDEVTKIDENSADVKVYSWRYGRPDEKETHTLAYNTTQRTISWKQNGHEFTLSPSDGSSNGEIQAGDIPVKGKKSKSFWDKVFYFRGYLNDCYNHRYSTLLRCIHHAIWPNMKLPSEGKTILKLSKK